MTTTEISRFEVPVLSVEQAVVLKALAWRSRLAAKDIADLCAPPDAAQAGRHARPRATHRRTDHRPGASSGLIRRYVDPNPNCSHRCSQTHSRRAVFSETVPTESDDYLVMPTCRTSKIPRLTHGISSIPVTLAVATVALV